MTEILRSTLASTSVFSHLDSETLDRLAASSDMQSFEDGAAIIEEGKPVEHLYIIVEGEVHVSTNALGRDVDLQTLGAGTYFGEVSLMSGKNATATVNAKGGAKVVAVSRTAISELVKEDESVRKVLEGVTLERAKDTLGKVLK